MSSPLHDRLVALGERFATGAAHDTADATTWIESAPAVAVEEVLACLDEQPVERWLAEPAETSAVLVALIRRLHVEPMPLPDDVLVPLRSVYPQLDARPAIQALLLRLLVASGSSAA